MSNNTKMEEEMNKKEEPLKINRISEIEMYAGFLDNTMQNDEPNFSHNTQQCNQLIVIQQKKLAVKRLTLIIILFICILALVFRCVADSKEKQNARKYYNCMDKTHSNIMSLQEQEEARQKIKAEEELKEKLANRNTKEFTPEQIERVKHIYNSNDKKIAYLTFDDGPSSNVTPLILDVLKDENIKATFFVLGNYATGNADVLKRIRKEGHYIANHGYSHKYDEIYADYESLISDYNACEQAIKKALGEPEYKTRIFRFPGGSTGGKYAKLKRDAKAQMEAQNITYLDWNSLTGDAEGVPTKESILTNLKNTTQNKNNVVVLMHDLSTKILTYETLLDVINYLRDQGYEFGDMYDLIGE